MRKSLADFFTLTKERKKRAARIRICEIRLLKYMLKIQLYLPLLKELPIIEFFKFEFKFSKFGLRKNSLHATA